MNRLVCIMGGLSETRIDDRRHTLNRFSEVMKTATPDTLPSSQLH